MLAAIDMWSAIEQANSFKDFGALDRTVNQLCDTSSVTAEHCKSLGFTYDSTEDTWLYKSISVWIDDMIIYKHIAFKNPTVKQLSLLLMLCEA